MVLPKGLEDIYQRYYYTPSFTSALGGVAPLRRKLMREQTAVIAKNSQKWLRTQDPYTLHKPVNRRFERRKIIVSGFGQQLQMDLIDVRSMKNENDGNSFILTAIDVFSKKAWAIPIKSKSGKDMSIAIASILEDAPTKYCQTDRGLEFLNRSVQDVFERYGVRHFSTHDDTTKAAIVERFNRTLQGLIYRWFTKTGTRKYIDVIQSIVDGYNDRYHRSIGMAPNRVNFDNQEGVWQKLYNYRTKPEKRSDEKLAVGDYVRISKVRMTFERGYTPNWSYEIFRVRKRLDTSPITYALRDLNGEDVEGGFYQSELQKVAKPQKFKVEKVLAEKKIGKKRYLLIKWLGYSDKFNQWVHDKEVTDI